MGKYHQREPDDEIEQLSLERAEMHRYLADLCPTLEADKLAQVVAWIAEIEARMEELGLYLDAER